MKSLQEISKNLRAAQDGLRAEIEAGAGNLDKAYADAKSAADVVDARLKALAANAPAAPKAKK